MQNGGFQQHALMRLTLGLSALFLAAFVVTNVLLYFDRMDLTSLFGDRVLPRFGGAVPPAAELCLDARGLSWPHGHDGSCPAAADALGDLCSVFSKGEGVVRRNPVFGRSSKRSIGLACPVRAPRVCTPQGGSISASPGEPHCTARFAGEDARQATSTSSPERKRSIVAEALRELAHAWKSRSEYHGLSTVVPLGQPFARRRPSYSPSTGGLCLCLQRWGPWC